MTETVAAPPEWIAQLPDDLKGNESFTSYKTVGDLAKSHLELGGKVKEFETKLADAIPKLPDDATDEEKGLYYDALGRPEKPEQYEFDAEDKNAPEWTGYWKQQFHSLGLTKTQAKTMSTLWNGQMQKIVDTHNAAIQKEVFEAEKNLRGELGDKYDASVELAKRLWSKHGGGDFDKDFKNGSGQNRFSTIRMILKFASLTGEDRSPMGVRSPGAIDKTSFINYDKSPAPPAR